MNDFKLVDIKNGLKTAKNTDFVLKNKYSISKNGLSK